MAIRNQHVWLLCLAIGIAVHVTDCDNIRLPDQAPQQQPSAPAAVQTDGRSLGGEGGVRQGKHLLDFVGLGTGRNTDPYIARTNANCLNGELADCFKSQALGTFTDFFSKQEYPLNANTRIVRVPEYEMRSLEQEPYEFSSEPRAEESEWDHLMKFALRKVERFIKSAAIEVQVPDELSEGGRYSPRFISDEIADEIDVIEDKKAPLFSRNKLKKLFIPMLIILKLFKLKLLLFLPLILGLASFKKILGFAAIVIPGVIGYFKLCKPQQSPFGGNHYNSNGFPQYSPQGLGTANYHTHYESGPSPYHHEQQSFSKPYGDYYGKSQQYNEYNGGGGNGGDGSVRFGEDAQNLAYQGYSQSQYRSKTVE